MMRAFLFKILAVGFWISLLSSTQLYGQSINACSDDYDVIDTYRVDTSSNHTPLIFRYNKCLLDLSNDTYLAVEIGNKSSKRVIVDINYKGPNKNHVNQGRFFVSANSNVIKKVILNRLKMTDTSSWMTYFSAERGLPGGYITHWNAFDLKTVKAVEIKVSSNERLSENDTVYVGRPCGDKTLEFFKRSFELEKQPMIDAMGQYNGAQWSNKLKNISDLKELGVSDIKAFSKSEFDDGFSKYGGWEKGPKQKVTGYFYTTKYKDKWYFVDPEGNLFWSQGVTGVGSGASTSTKNRELLFPKFLNEKHTPEWSYLSKSIKQNGINFYGLNLGRKYGSQWERIHNKVTSRRFKSWGINTYGAWSKVPNVKKHPFTLIIHPRKQGIGSIPKMVDPFSNDFKVDLKSRLKTLQSHKSDPWLLGIFVNNELHWGNGWSIPMEVLKLDSSIPARKAFENTLKLKYESIANLNKSWNSNFQSFKAINSFKASKQSVTFKEDMFLYFELFTETYFKTVAKELKKVLPNHLYLGSRFHGGVKSNKLIHKVASRYCDVLSFNIYEYSVKDFKIYNEVDKPAIIGEFHFGTGSHGVWGMGLRSAFNLDDQADLYKQYIRDAAMHPKFIGAHWFQMRDQMTTGRGSDGENFRIGIVNITDQPYQTLIDAIKQSSDSLYEIRVE